MDQPLRGIPSKDTPDLADVSEMQTGYAADVADMCLHIEMFVKYDTQVAHLG